MRRSDTPQFLRCLQCTCYPLPMGLACERAAAFRICRSNEKSPASRHTPRTGEVRSRIFCRADTLQETACWASHASPKKAVRPSPVTQPASVVRHSRAAMFSLQIEVFGGGGIARGSLRCSVAESALLQVCYS